MPRYTLTLSPNYVKNWTDSDAIREFIQNAIDQEHCDPSNTKDIYIDGDSLVIANKTSKLSKSSLLLGGGTKSEGDNNIGQFGEGYKVALLVLLRDGFKITINNYGASELWIPKIVNSKVYESEVLAIDTQEFEFEGYNPNSLEIIITKEDYDFKETLSTIWLEFETSLDDLDCIHTNKCTILLDEQYENKIYVKGLYIGELKGLKYGYSFEPSMIKIGRDRNLVNSFDVYWALSKYIWNSVDYSDEKVCNIVKELIKEEAKEVEYLDVNYLPSSFKEIMVEDYKDKYVISCESDKEAIKETYGNVETTIVPDKIKTLVYNYQTRETGIRVEVKSAYTLLEEFIEKYENTLSYEMLEDLDKIMERI